MITGSRSGQHDTGTGVVLVPMTWSREFYRTEERIVSDWIAKLVESLLLVAVFTTPWAERATLDMKQTQEKAELRGDKFHVACATGSQQCQI